MKCPHHALDVVKLSKVPGVCVATSGLEKQVQEVQVDAKNKL